ncbi:hypothetical protein DDE82_002948 [Stemphylium lycopersici]|nr:hypothetical protein DDE82_002948 [Stemphylium lycopersici]
MSQPVAHELSHNAPGTVNGSSALDTPYIASSTDNNPAQHSYHVAVEQNHPQEIPAPIALGQFPNPAKEKPPPYSFFDGETAAAAREQAHSAVPAPNTNAQDPTTTSETAPPPPLTKEPIQFAFAASNYLKSPSNLDPANVDLNKLGILYEYSDSYFVVLEVPPYPGGAAALRRGFMRRDVRVPRAIVNVDLSHYRTSDYSGVNV